MIADAQIEEKITEAGLLGFSANEGMTPELIDDAINGTLGVYASIDMNALANRIAARKERYASSGTTAGS